MDKNEIYGTLVAICREVDRESGAVAVYEIKADVSADLMAKLSIRSRMNPELRYFVTPRTRWEGCWRDDITALLQRRHLTDAAIQRFGGIVAI